GLRLSDSPSARPMAYRAGIGPRCWKLSLQMRMPPFLLGSGLKGSPARLAQRPRAWAAPRRTATRQAASTANPPRASGPHSGVQARGDPAFGKTVAGKVLDERAVAAPGGQLQ